MYKAGDAVVYPMHGAGVIEKIEEKELHGRTQEYYVMKMPFSSMKVMIPTSSVETVGIRNVISSSEADNVIQSFISDGQTVNSNWNKRFRENMVKIKSGNIYQVAEVLKMLMLRDRNRGLSMGERKMLSSAKQIFISEIMLAKNVTNDEVEKKLSSIVDSQLNEA